MAREKSKIRVAVRLTKEEHEALQSRAAAEDRSMANLSKICLIDGLSRRTEELAQEKAN